MASVCRKTWRVRCFLMLRARGVEAEFLLDAADIEPAAATAKEHKRLPFPADQAGPHVVEVLDQVAARRRAERDVAVFEVFALWDEDRRLR